MNRTSIAAAIAVGAWVSLGPPALSENDDNDQRFGTVHFATSCNETAQRRFNRAIAILHSMWYEEAVKAFTGVAEADPACAMAWWGVAMSHWYPLWYPPTPTALKGGAAAVAKAEAISAKTERERGYIAAIAAFYRDSDTVDHRTRPLRMNTRWRAFIRIIPTTARLRSFMHLPLMRSPLPPTKRLPTRRRRRRSSNRFSPSNRTTRASLII